MKIDTIKILSEHFEQTNNVTLEESTSILENHLNKKIILESFTDKIKELWEKIKKFFSGLWLKIKSFFKKLWERITGKKESVKEEVENEVKETTKILEDTKKIIKSDK